MSEFSLQARSPLAGILTPGSSGKKTDMPGVVIEERTGFGLANILARKGQNAALAERFRERYGVDLPVKPKAVGESAMVVVWSGPDQWLAVAPEDTSGGIETELREIAGATASIADQSDGRLFLRLSGPHIRDTLAKGLPIDLHDRVFQPGDAAITAAAHISVQIWQVDDTPTYDLVMFRASAKSFCEWLAGSAAEFGVQILSDR